MFVVAQAVISPTPVDELVSFFGSLALLITLFALIGHLVASYARAAVASRPETQRKPNGPNTSQKRIAPVKPSTKPRPVPTARPPALTDQWFNSQQTLAQLQNLTPRDFEKHIAILFGKLGFSAKTTPFRRDGGIDVIAVKDGEPHFIQCKKFISSKVTLSQVRDFYGAMADAACPRGFFVTTGHFTLDAERFAAGKPIELINGNRLLDYLKEAGVKLTGPKVSPAEARAKMEKNCPKCGKPLVVRVAKKGSHAGSEFWGCSGFPECRFTEPLA